MKPLRSLKFSSKNLCLTWLRKNLVPIFFWKSVEPYIGPALRYVDLRSEGRKWIAALHCHVLPSSMEERLGNWSRH